MEASTFVTRPLAEGVTLYVRPTRQFKKVTVRLFFHHPLGEDAGLTALVPRVLLRGSRLHPTTADLARYREELYGLGLDAEIGKIGRDQLVEWELTGVHPQFVGAGQELLRQQLGLLAEVITDPLWQDGTSTSGQLSFRADYVDQEKRVLQDLIASLINDKRSYAMVRLYQEMFAGDPFSIYRYGSAEGIEPVTPHQLAEQYQRLLQESPLTIFVVGDVDPVQIEEQLRELWAQLLHDRPGHLPAGGWMPSPHPVRRTHEPQPTRQALLYLGYSTGGITYASDAYPALTMYSAILGGFPHSKLFLQVREKASLAYFAWTRLESTMGAMVATCGINAQDEERALDIIQHQVEAMARGDFTEEEWSATLEGLITGLRSAYDSPNSLIDRVLMGVVNGRQRPIEEMIAALQRVTKDQVVEVAQKVQLDTIYFLGEREAQG
ncbi:MAG: insulinase family protein [Limnochordaceae bacterium]|nr:insulinase family protein [Limnochordaceae bacterium]